MAETNGAASSEGKAVPPSLSAGHITEDEASLYDRQIRLWGLEAQNRMRSSTVLILSLRSLAHETIKNLVLAGIGRLIVMDDGLVTEEDLGSGFLFREEDGAVGLERVTAALPQIQSLNPLVSLTALPTLAPFVRDPQTSGAMSDDVQEMVDYLKKEKVDVIVACDMSPAELERIDEASRLAGTRFYGAGSYGFFGYVFADLGEKYEYAVTPPSTSSNPSPSIAKRTLSYPSLSRVLDRSHWDLPSTKASEGGSPYRDLTRNQTKERAPEVALGILALWEYQKRHQSLPSPLERKKRPRNEEENGDAKGKGKAEDEDEGNWKAREELVGIVEELRVQLGINSKAWTGRAGVKGLKEESERVIQHLADHATHTFPPTLAVLGGLLAQDVLRALSLKDTPIANLLCVDSMGGSGAVGRWAMGESVDG